MKRKYFIALCCTLVMIPDICLPLAKNTRAPSYLFGTFSIDDHTEGKESADVPYYFAFRDSSSADQFIYDPGKLILFKCAYSPEDPFKIMKVPAGEYRVYSLMRISENQTCFETGSEGVAAGTELEFIGTAAVKPGEALYLGDYHMTFSPAEEGSFEVSWTIKDEFARDSGILRKKGNTFSKIPVTSVFIRGKRKAP